MFRKITFGLAFLVCLTAFAADLQPQWRWCNKCQSAFFAGAGASVCPKDNGPHNMSSGGAYFVPLEGFAASGQAGWRRCSKCQALFFSGPGAPNVCPAGGVHTESGGGDRFKMLQTPAAAVTVQESWNYCTKCGGLFFGPNEATSSCPAGGTHHKGGVYFMVTGMVNNAISVSDEQRFPFGNNTGEVQSTVVGPGVKNGDCPAGRVLITDDAFTGRPNAVRYRDLNATAPDLMTSTWGAIPAAIAANYAYNTSDHDIVSMSNGDVYYITAAWSKGPVPDASLAWPGQSWRDTFGPRARTTMLVWRSQNCGTSFEFMPSLELDPAAVGFGLCALPQEPRAYAHEGDLAADYLALTGPHPDAPATEGQFRFCGKCRQLISIAQGQQQSCPTGGLHAPETGTYFVATSAIGNHLDEGTWRKCAACGSMYREGGSNACAQPHDGSQSAEYFLVMNDASRGPAFQAGWRWCSKCRGLFFGANIGSKCPAGGRHDANGSSEYYVPFANANVNGEDEWRWCARCQGLWRKKPGIQNACPAGGAHTDNGGHYKLMKAPDGSTQGGWRYCRFCGGLFEASNSATSCPARRTHIATPPVYHMARAGGPGSNANMQQGWRRCKKCQALYFGGRGVQGCPIPSPGGPLVNMGGTDGQLARADRATNRVYLTHQCVGKMGDGTTLPLYELSATPINRTLVAWFDATAPDAAKTWNLIGYLDQAQWRMGIVRLKDDELAYGLDTAVIRQKPGGNAITFPAVTTAAGWGGNWKDPNGLITPNTLAHTILGRVPGTSTEVFLAFADQIPNRGRGYRLFYLKDGTFTEASNNPIAPQQGNGHFAFHLQAIDFGDGPVLLYWYDVNTSAMTITIRGRFVTGRNEFSEDFDISRTLGATNKISFANMTYWYGDYQTAGGYSGATQFVYYPVWVEPGAPTNSVSFARVTLAKPGTASLPVITATDVKTIPPMTIKSIPVKP